MADRFPLVFTLFFALGFFLRPTPVWAMVFYAGVTPLFLLYVRRHGFGRLAPGVFAALAVTVWFGLTLVWGVDQPQGRVQGYAISAFINSVLVLAGFVFFRNADEADFARFARTIALAAAANALLSLVLHFGFRPNEGRLGGWAETRHPILGADVMAVAFVFAAEAIRRARSRRETILFAACAVLTVVFILLSGSRGPLLALAAATACLLIPSRTARFLALAAAASAVLAYFAVPAVDDFVHTNLSRTPYRFEIWSATLDYVRERPFVGHGVANVRWFVDPQFTFPHSIYMSALYYGGAIGLTLLLALFATAAWAAWRIPNRNERLHSLALLAIPVVAGLTDIGQAIKAPSEEWYIVWLPVLAVLGRALRRTP